MNSASNSLISAATAYVACHGFIDVRIVRRGIDFQQCDSRHDLTRVAISALRDIIFDPGLFYRMSFGDAFYGGDLLSLSVFHRHLARALRFSVYMDSACAALGDSASELGPGEPDLFPYDP